jgi:hypothetical protein
MKIVPKFLFLFVIEFAIIFTVGSFMNWFFAAQINLLGLVIATATASVVVAFATTMLLLDSEGKWRLSQ